jgi:hypothetical protein
VGRAAPRSTPPIFVAAADAARGFGRPQRIGRGVLSSVAIADDGTAVMA